MNADKKKEMDYDYSLKWWLVIWDKCIIAIIILSASSFFLFFSNVILSGFNGLLSKNLDDHRDSLNRETGKHLEGIRSELTKGLEEHRHRLAMQQFVAQKRFDAIDGVITAYNKLFAQFVNNTREKEITPEIKEKYRLAINGVFEAHSNKELVMPREFSDQLEKLGFMHRGLLVNGFSDDKYMKLFVNLGDQFSEMGRDAIDPPPPDKQKKYFILAPLPSPAERRSNKAAAKYLDAELRRWEQWTKANNP